MSWKNLGQIPPGEHYHKLCESTFLTFVGENSVEEVVDHMAKYVNLPAAYVVCGKDVLIWEDEEKAKKALARVAVLTANYIPAILPNGEAWEGKLYSDGRFLPLVKTSVSDPSLYLHVDRVIS